MSDIQLNMRIDEQIAERFRILSIKVQKDYGGTLELLLNAYDKKAQPIKNSEVKCDMCSISIAKNGRKCPLHEVV